MLTLHAKEEAHEYQPVDLANLDDDKVRTVLTGILRHCRNTIGGLVKIYEVPFSVRAVNALKRANIETMLELSLYPHEFRAAGTKTMNEFREQLIALNLPLPEAVRRKFAYVRE